MSDGSIFGDSLLTMDSVVQTMNGDQDDVKPVTVGLDYPTLRKRKVDCLI